MSARTVNRRVGDFISKLFSRHKVDWIRYSEQKSKLRNLGLVKWKEKSREIRNFEAHG